MKSLLLASAVVLLAIDSRVFAEGRRGNVAFPSGDARRSMGNLRPGGAPAAELAAGRHGGGGHGGGGYGGGGHGHGSHYRHGGWYGPYHGGWQPYDYCYAPYGYPYPYPPPYLGGSLYVAPQYLPGEALYGPQALKRFWGWDQVPPARPNVNVIVVPDKDGAGDRDDAKQREVHPEVLARAWKFIGYGDNYFGAQKYSDAYQRYKKAAQTTATLADAHFRQGYALVALGRYELAAKALKRGLELDPDWARSNFRNDDLYGDNGMAKTAHLDALALAATKKPNDADLLFLLGVYLHFDGQADRAKPFFDRAAELAGDEDAHLGAFLREL